jgi:glycosyltransferase involved in cell wall biosynthesis
MEVLLIHQAFASPDEPGGTRHYELARYLAERGVRFTVIASDRSYLTGLRATTDEADCPRVVRVRTFASGRYSFSWRVVSFVSFMFASLLAALKEKRIDVVMGTSPPLFQALSAWAVALIRRRTFLLEIRDLWPEFAIDMGVLRSRTLIALSRWLERFLYARATHIVVNSPAYREYLRGKGIPDTKISLIANGVDPDMFDPASKGEAIRREFSLNGNFLVTYAGALGLANDIPTILRAADILRDDPRIHILLVGDGRERARLESLARKQQLSNVTFAGSRPKSQMAELLAAADVCVATLKDIPMFRTTYPNKVFDYMAAGRPVLLAIDGVIREVVESAGAGVYVPPGDAQSLANSVRYLADNPRERELMSRRGRECVEQLFNRAHQSEQFGALLDKIALQA